MLYELVLTSYSSCRIIRYFIRQHRSKDFTSSRVKAEMKTLNSAHSGMLVSKLPRHFKKCASPQCTLFTVISREKIASSPACYCVEVSTGKIISKQQTLKMPRAGLAYQPGIVAILLAYFYRNMHVLTLQT